MLSTAARIAALSAATVTAACTMAPDKPEQPSAAPPAAQSTGCDAAKASFAEGQTYSDEIAQRAREASGARTVRALRPGQAVTLEYLHDRLNLKLDDAGRIESASCG